MNRWKYGSTVATTVCCSMNSDTSVRYGLRTRRHLYERVLLTRRLRRIWDRLGKYAGKLDLTNPRVHRKDNDFAVTWAKMYGKGRVFYSTLGHPAESWNDPDIQKMYFEAIKWALGLTQYDVKPHPLPGDVRPPQGPRLPAQATPARGARQGAPAGAAPAR